jgi:hypothetical protein
MLQGRMVQGPAVQGRVVHGWVMARDGVPDRGAEGEGAAHRWGVLVAVIAAGVRDGWRAGAAALWAAGRRREAAWLRADHREAARVIAGAASGRPLDVARALRTCRAMARASAAHPMLAAPWRDAARALAIAAGTDRPGDTDAFADAGSVGRRA